jgi:hypothetical protein
VVGTLAGRSLEVIAPVHWRAERLSASFEKIVVQDLPAAAALCHWQTPDVVVVVVVVVVVD